jgi:hypothetical protein
MLDGKAPANRDEQVMLMNFMAANIAHGVEPAACRLMKTLYGDHFGLLTDDDVERIALYQQGLK